LWMPKRGSRLRDSAKAKLALFVAWGLCLFFFCATVYMYQALRRQAVEASIVSSKLRVFERVEESLKEENKDKEIEFVPSNPASPSPQATERPTWIDIEFLRRGINIDMFEQMEKNSKKGSLNYIQFQTKEIKKQTKEVVAEEVPGFRTEFRDVPFAEELTHGISWLMDLSRFVELKVQSPTHSVLLLTTMHKPDKSRPYFQRSQRIWDYAKRHKYTAAHCFRKRMMETTEFGNFTIEDDIWNAMCIHGAFQKKEFRNTDVLFWLDESAYIRPKYQYIPLTHFTDSVSVGFPLILQDNGGIPDTRTLILRNIAAGRKIIYFWILEIYQQIWCPRGECVTNQTTVDMAFSSVYVDELHLLNNAKKKSTKAIDRLKMKHQLRRVIDSVMGKPYVFPENFESFYKECLGRQGVHEPFFQYDRWSPPIRFLGRLSEPSTAYGELEEKRAKGPNDHVPRKSQRPSLSLFNLKESANSFVVMDPRFIDEEGT